MANFTAADVKALREQTGAGMMDVKKALTEADGDAEKALEIIRLKGLKSLSKREGRQASAGLLAALRLRQGPVLVLVDDAERIDDSDHALAELLAESPPNVRIAAAGRADDLRTLYSHWTKTLRRSRCGILLQPNVDMDGDLLSARIPRRAPVVMTVGRGYLCLNGGAALIQTALPQ